MFMINKIPLTTTSTIYYLKNNLSLLIISIIGSTPLIKYIVTKIKTSKYRKLIDLLEVIAVLALLILVTSFLIDESFNPFLYFRF